MTNAANEEALSAARLWAATEQPYLATCLFAMSTVWAEGIDTFGVDRNWRLYVDPATLSRWSTEEAGSVLLHEAHHLLRDHASRAQALGVTYQERFRFNIAGDMEINDDLTELRLPPNGVFPWTAGFRTGELAETYFAQLSSELPPGWDCGEGADGVPRAWPAPPGDTPRVEAAEADLIRQQVAEAVRAGARAGQQLPSGVQRWAESFLHPQVDWRVRLAGEVRSGVVTVAGRVDYTYGRPNRRQGRASAPRVVMPSLLEPVPRIAIVVDTSASMSPRALGRALGEINGIIRAQGLTGRDVAVLSCDTAVRVTQTVFSSHEVRLYGGGGTDMGVGLTAAAQLRPRPQIVIVLTDGETPWPEARPEVQRIIAALIGSSAPAPPQWARVVRIDV